MMRMIVTKTPCAPPDTDGSASRNAFPNATKPERASWPVKSASHEPIAPRMIGADLFVSDAKSGITLRAELTASV